MPYQLTKLFIGAITLLIASYVFAVGVGPKLGPNSNTTAPEQIVPDKPVKLNIPPLDLAVIVLDPKLNEEEQKLREKGIWPEVRKTESIRSAYRIKEAIENLNQFENVLVAPSGSVSSDLYLLGQIEESTTEEMTIRWRLLDATGDTWIPSTKTEHRVQLGWHERFYKPGYDAFNPLYTRIASEVRTRLGTYAKAHRRIQDQNQRLIRRGKSPKSSELDTITHVRDLVLAQFFAPSVYRDTLSEKKGQYVINYLPDTNTSEWLRIQSFARKDQDVAEKFDEIYKDFFDQTNPSYENWLNEVYPFARQARINKAKSRRDMILGSLVLIAAVAAGAEHGNTGVQDRILVGGGLIGGGLLANSFFERQDYKQNLALFDEMSRNYHDQFEPLNVQVVDDIVSLSGSAQEQFSSWRQLLKEMYDQADVDTFDIEIVKTQK